MSTMKSKLRRGTQVLSAVLVVGVTSLVYAEPDLTDTTISDKIEDEMLYDPGVNSVKVDVSTSSGVVTLTGQVNNILAKERATRIAEKVKGVRSVVNRIEVEPSVFRSDVQIERDIRSALLDDPATEAYEITAEVEDGVVTLSGTVDSYQERQLAEIVAKGVRGVKEVEDNIGVDYETERSDSEIKHDIEQALRWNAYVDDNAITVDVKEGKVTLSGTVGSAAEKRLAKYDAWVAGTESVNLDKLSVEDWARNGKLRGEKYVVKSEDEIQQAVNDALLMDPRVMSFNVDADVTGSMVTLRGTVDNLKAKRAAEEDARNTVGVSAVSNRLKVRFDAPPGETEIAEDIRSALLRDPYVDRFEITVTVVDNTAHLYGTVDTFFEKNTADDIASRVPGVFDVENHLTVEYGTPYIYDPYLEDEFIEENDIIDYERRTPYQTDSQIKESVESELWWSPFVEEEAVEVSVDEGVVTLTGEVDSWSEFHAATENAYEGGATLVDNELIVSYD